MCGVSCAHSPPLLSLSLSHARAHPHSPHPSPTLHSPSGAPIVCDVRDVARAHVAAAELPSASGRYIVSHAAPLPPALVASVLASRLPGCAVLPPVLPDDPATALRPRIDGSRAAAELGLGLTPLAETVGDMVTAMVALGLATPREAGGGEAEAGGADGA